MMQLPLLPETGVRFESVSTWHPELVPAIRAHYTGSRGAPPGRKLAWRIFENGHHRGWLVLGEPSFKLSPRRRLGLMDARPLPGTVSCCMYRLDSPGPTHASVILKAWHARAEAEWLRRYGEQVLHWETMCLPCGVDGVVGYCFRRAGYRSLGWTTGRSARRPAGHTHGPRVWCDADPKMVLYRGPLQRLPAPPS